jgi:uncharacterized protein (TIGR03435 family)
MRTEAFAFRVGIVAGLLVPFNLPARAQSPSQPVFEVASVRLSSPGIQRRYRITDTRVDAANVPMRWVLLTAFGLTSTTEFQLIAPGWVDDTRVDIQATIPAGRARRDVPLMLQALLRERFGLMAHVEPRPMDVYELLVDAGGPKMTEVEPLDELTPDLQDNDSAKSRSGSLSETVDGPIRSETITLGYRTTTTRARYDRVFTERRTQIIDATRISIAEFASILTTTMDQPVIDKTGLAGLYRFTVELPPDATSLRRLMAIGITTTVRGTPLTDPTGFSVFKAVEGLGLKLEQRRSPVDVVVVGTLNTTPTPN